MSILTFVLSTTLITVNVALPLFVFWLTQSKDDTHNSRVSTLQDIAGIDFTLGVLSAGTLIVALVGQIPFMYGLLRDIVHLLPFSMRGLRMVTDAYGTQILMFLGAVGVVLPVLQVMMLAVLPKRLTA